MSAQYVEGVFVNEATLALQYVNKARKSEAAGHEFTLPFSAFKRFKSVKTCHYTGMELTTPTEGKVKQTDRTLDRIDSTKGYVVGNVVACSHYANQVKSVLENPSSTIELKHLTKLTKTLGEYK